MARVLKISLLLSLTVTLGLGRPRARAPYRSSSRSQEAVAASSNRPSAATIVGQTTTLLPDGSQLVLGGMGQTGPIATALVEAPGSNQGTALSSSLIVPRAWHTATILPDGTVLVLGGVDAAGKALARLSFSIPQRRNSRR